LSTADSKPVPPDAAGGPPLRLQKEDVKLLLSKVDLAPMTSDGIRIEHEGETLQVETTLDSELQQYLYQKLDLDNSRYIGIVAMQPEQGRIISMVSYDRVNPERNLCLDSIFPAASIFKIVTAAAAIDEADLDADSSLIFNGGKHTLYKSQLKNRRNRYSHEISLKDSFAQSVNPVFGKLGVHRLGKETLEAYASAFGFNREIPFEMPVAPSRIEISDEPYHWAEIASGFNQQTTISPVHGAMIGSTVLNRGKVLAPTMIDSIRDSEGRSVYQGRPELLGNAFTGEAADILRRLMTATVTSGTARKAFRGYRNDRVLSRLTIGGKTGSINVDPRYDWFVGIAAEKGGGKKIAVAVVVAHQKYIGIRASQYARMIMKHFFEAQFEAADKKIAQTTP
jgi:cell division protein FtsI/penicillin-binding protein 2